MKKLLISLLICISPAISFSQEHSGHAGHQNGHNPTDRVAVCELSPTQGNNVTGTITFAETSGGILVTADLKGLTKGDHGIHIHEKGDCSAPDGSSAGGHFNPDMKQHGSPDSDNRHMGDLGNITADDQGNAHLQYTDKMLVFDGEESIIGKSVIVHASADDLKTQPTGNSGARVACGVIELR